MTKLYLCEKPSQARDIARVLKVNQKQEGFLSSADTTVTWCFGHLLEAAPPESYHINLKPWRREVLPIVPDKWQMHVKKDCVKQLNIIKKLLGEANIVVIATDADREGETIAREVLEYCSYRGTIQRLWLSSLDEKSIETALAQVREGKTTESLFAAGLGRQRADWLIGMNLTMAATIAFSQGQGVLSVGRVQTPTLRLIVERDDTIQNFKPIDYYELLAQFSTSHSTFWAKWLPPIDVVDEHQHCLSKDIVGTVLQKVAGQSGEVAEFNESMKTQSPPVGLSLSALQKLASHRFGLSAKETLDVAQALYETHKATTYPRADCGYLPTSQLSDAKEILNNLKKSNPNLSTFIDKCDAKIQSPIWNDKKITAHHAIIPTRHAGVTMQAMSEKERKVYEVICHYYIAQFLGDYHYSLRTAIMVVKDEKFKVSSHTPLKAGWKALLQSVDDSATDEEDNNAIPNLTPHQPVSVVGQKIMAKQTTPPAPFTEGTLIDAMKSIGKLVTDPAYKKILKETAGIGTEATRAAIIETLLKRGFVIKKGKQLIATDRGRELIATLPQTVSDPLLTAEWEQALESVAQGELSLDDFLKKQSQALHTLLQALDNQVTKTAMTPQFQCPLCHKFLQKRYSKINKNYFWGCSAYPLCRATYPDQDNKPCFDPNKRRKK